MTAVLISQADAGSPEWHEARANGIGGSEIAAVVGLSPWESAYSLWLKKKGLIPSEQTGAHLAWGNRLEPVIREHFTSLHPELCDYVDGGTFAHPNLPWQIANPDGLLHGEGCAGPTPPTALLEVKTSRFGDGFGPSGSDEIPIQYRCQVQWYLDVLDLPTAYVAVLIGGNEYREYRIEADREDQAALREAGAAFWASLATDHEPPVDCSFATYEAIRARHPEIDGEDVEINPALYGSYVLTKADAESAADAHRQVKSELLKAIGTARRALVGGTPVLRRQPGRGGSVSLYPIKEN